MKNITLHPKSYNPATVSSESTLYMFPFVKVSDAPKIIFLFFIKFIELIN